MFKWLKDLFKIQLNPEVKVEQTPKYSYVYMGDGMMEEVDRKATKAGDVGKNAKPFNAKVLKGRLEQRSMSADPLLAHTFTPTYMSTFDSGTSSRVCSSSSYSSSNDGGSYDSGSSSSSDSSSGGCD